MWRWPFLFLGDGHGLGCMEAVGGFHSVLWATIKTFVMVDCGNVVVTLVMMLGLWVWNLLGIKAGDQTIVMENNRVCCDTKIDAGRKENNRTIKINLTLIQSRTKIMKIIC
jgi:hypothetical protein